MFKSFLKLATVVGVVGAIVVSPISTLKAEALTEAQVLERLNGIPVFAITDEKGSPLLGSLPKQANATQKEPSQILLFFLNPDDAKSMLTQIKTTNPAVGNKAQIVVRSLNDAYQVIKKNGDKKIAFQIVPSKTSLDSAKSILSSQGKPTDQLPNVPVFFAVGGSEKDQGLLTIEQNGKQFVPFFFDQKDLQSLIDRAKEQQPNLASGSKIQVTSLFQVLDSMVTKDNKPNPDAERFTFVPSRVAFEYVIKNQPQAAPANSPTQPKLQPQNKPKPQLQGKPPVTPKK